MLNLPDRPGSAAASISRRMRRVGLRELARRTRIPLTTIARIARDPLGARFWKVLVILDAISEEKP